MFIIWGSTTKSRHVESGQFVCPGCRRPSEYELTGVYKYFTLFFIPLFQTKHLGGVVVCRRCQGSFDAAVLDEAPEPTEPAVSSRPKVWKCGACGDRNPVGQKSCKTCASPAPAVAIDLVDFEPAPRRAPPAFVAEPGARRGHQPARTSPLAIVSLIVGLLSPLLVVACGLSLFTSLAAIVTGHLAKAGIRKSNGALIGGGMAMIGLVAGYLSLLLTAGFFAFIFTRPDQGLAGPQHPAREAFNLAEREINSDRNGTFHGNSLEARQLAEVFHTMLSGLDDAAFERPGFEAFEGKYDVWCELRNGRCAFLVHVPDYRKFKDDARETLAELAWLTALTTVQTALEPGDRLAVGLKGDILWGDIMVGSIASDAATDANDPLTKTSAESDLYPFFDAAAVDVADQPQRDAPREPADPRIARAPPFGPVDPITGRPLAPPMAEPTIPRDPLLDPALRGAPIPPFPVTARTPTDETPAPEAATPETVPGDAPAATTKKTDPVTETPAPAKVERSDPPPKPQTSLFPESLDEAVEFLASDDKEVRQRGINWLHSHPPETPNPEVAGKLLAILKDDKEVEPFTASMAVKEWATADKLPELKELLDHDNVLVRQQVLDTIGGLKTKESAELLVELLSDSDHRFTASTQLQQMGEVAEEPVLKRLRDPDSDVRQDVCRILGEVGTSKSMRPLNALSKDKDFGVRFAADSAAKKIRSRLKDR